MIRILLLLAAWAVVSTSESLAKPPNILLILVDDLGYGDLSCYGAEDLQSPYIDKLVAGGLKFTNFYANCPVCSPTRASVLTGRYPDMVGVPGVIRTHRTNNWGYLAKDAVLLPCVLKRIGYQTAIVGKWHLGLESPNIPNDRGFDYFRGWLGDMMDDYYTHRRHEINYMRHDRRIVEPQGHATDLFSQWASDYLARRTSADAPFFLYLAYNAPHTPIQPPQDWLQRVQRRVPDAGIRRAKLIALIEHMDHGIGRVLDTLEQTGQSENTLVIFTSDNGGQLNVGANNGPLRDGKQSMYEGGLRVPMAARWPGRIRPGESEYIGLSMDLFPTICKVAGANYDGKIDGIDFSGVLLGGQNPAPRRDLYFTRREGGNRYGGKTIEALRRGDWKLLQNSPFAPMELYNLRDDPHETRDLAGVNKKKFNELAAALRQRLQNSGSVPWQKPGNSD